MSTSLHQGLAGYLCVLCGNLIRWTMSTSLHQGLAGYPCVFCGNLISWTMNTSLHQGHACCVFCVGIWSDEQWVLHFTKAMLAVCFVWESDQMNNEYFTSPRPCWLPVCFVWESDQLNNEYFTSPRPCLLCVLCGNLISWTMSTSLHQGPAGYLYVLCGIWSDEQWVLRFTKALLATCMFCVGSDQLNNEYFTSPRPCWLPVCFVWDLISWIMSTSLHQGLAGYLYVLCGIWSVE